MYGISQLVDSSTTLHVTQTDCVMGVMDFKKMVFFEFLLNTFPVVRDVEREYQCVHIKCGTTRS